MNNFDIKNVKRSFGALLLLAMGLIIFTSCQEDDENVEQPVQGRYTFVVRSEGSSDESTDYIIATDSLMSGTISIVGQGIEQAGYHFYEQTGGHLITVGYEDVNNGTVYTQNDDDIVQMAGQFSIPQFHLFGSIDDETTMAVSIPRNGSELATFHVIDPATRSITKQVQTNVWDITTAENEQAYFSGFHVRDGKLYAPFFHIQGTENNPDNSFASQYTDSAYVAVYSYPELEFEKLITDERAGVIGKYIGEGHIFEDEKGDIYTTSTTGIASGHSPSTKPSGILKIANGTSDFDENYFFNVEDVSGGYKIHNINYIGGGKALANIFTFTNHTEDQIWSYGPCNLVVLDIYNKTVTQVENVPAHNGGPVPLPHQMVEEDGLYYMKVKNDDGTFMYEIDVENATATKGAQVLGADVYGIFKLND